MVRILQDHTDFLGRIIAQAKDHVIGAPLNVEILEAIRSACVGAKWKGKTYTRGQLQDLMQQADPKESRQIALRLAEAVELDIEAWYCVADITPLNGTDSGPVLTWNGGQWWGKLKGIEAPTGVEFDEQFTKRRARNSSRPVKAPEREVAPRAAMVPSLLGANS